MVDDLNLDEPQKLKQLKRDTHFNSEVNEIDGFFDFIKQLAKNKDGSIGDNVTTPELQSNTSTLEYTPFPTTETTEKGNHKYLFIGDILGICRDIIGHVSVDANPVLTSLREKIEILKSQGEDVSIYAETYRNISELEGKLDYSQKIVNYFFSIFGKSNTATTLSITDQKKLLTSENLITLKELANALGSITTNLPALDTILKNLSQLETAAEEIDKEEKSADTKNADEPEVVKGIKKEAEVKGEGDAGSPITPESTEDIDPSKALIKNKALQTEAARLTSILLFQENLWGINLNDENIPLELRERLSQQISKEVQSVLLGLTPEQQRELISNPSRRIEYLNKLMFQLMPTALMVGNDLSGKSPFHDDLEQAVHEVYLKANQDERDHILEILNRSNDPDYLPSILKDIADIDTQGNRFSPEEKTVQSYYNPATYKQEFFSELEKATVVNPDATKLAIQQRNINSILTSLTVLGFPPEMLFDEAYPNGTPLSKDKFELLFGKDVPYTNEFLQILRQYYEINSIELATKYKGINFILQDVKHLNSCSLEDFNKQYVQQVGVVMSRGPEESYAVKTGNGENIDVEGLTPEQAEDRHNYVQDLTENTQLEIWKSLSDQQKLDMLISMGVIDEGDDTISEEQATQGAQSLSPDIVILVGLVQTAPGVIPMEVVYGSEQTGGQEGMHLNPGSPEYYAPHPAAQVGAPPNSKMGQVAGLAKQYAKNQVKKAVGKQVGKFATKKLAQSGMAKLAGGAVGGPAGVALAVGAELLTNKDLRDKVKKALAVAAVIPAAVAAILAQVGPALGAMGGAVLGAVVGTMFGVGPVIGAAIGAGVGGSLGFMGSGGFGNLFGGGGGSSVASGIGTGASQVANAASSTVNSAMATSTPAASTIGAKATAAKLGTTGTTVMHSTAGQAILATTGTVALFSVVSYMSIQNALLADFSNVTPVGTIDAEGRESKYATITKEIYIPGCPDNRCENPEFPFEAEYTITITPKEDYVLTVKGAEDEISVNHNKEVYKEIGKNIPKLEPEEIDSHLRTLEDFPELSEDQEIQPGEEVVIQYRQLISDNYQHASVRNTFELKFEYDNGTDSGKDYAITGDYICVGECPAGLGCWPADGFIGQLPYKVYEKISTHAKLDSFDINNDLGTPIYAPFAGEMCATSCESGYGCAVKLTTQLEGKEYTFMFAHFEEPPIPMNTCKDVIDGGYIGPMGNRGNSTRPHLHYELYAVDGAREYDSPPSDLVNFVPDGQAIVELDVVRSCYAN